MRFVYLQHTYSSTQLDNISPAMSTDTPVTTPESTGTGQQNHHQQQANQKSFSCVLCAQRKVKCDKKPSGCSNCYKARVDCVYKVPPPPRRQKRGLREIDNRARLRIYEDALRKVGVDPEALVKQELDRTKRRASLSTSKAVNDFYEAVLPETVRSELGDDHGLLVSGEGRSRYLENTLWTSLKGEFRDTKEILDDSSSEEDDDSAVSPPTFSHGSGGNLLFGASKSAALNLLHPQPIQIFKIWQIYLDNINPLLKVFHTPSVQQLISSASGHLEDLPRNTEALLFAIYAVSVESLDDSECMDIMNETKATATRRFRAAAQMALINANFMKTSDPIVLQALVLLIASLQNDDPRVIWILTGVATRIGQRLGLHRDPETLSLSPFESEMRRRLWWQIVMQDGFAEKLAGTGRTQIVSEVRRPANLNDSDLFPGMKGLPKEHEGATDMMFFLIRVHVGVFVSRSTLNTTSSFNGVWNKITSSTISLDVKLRAIDEFEAMYDRKFLRYCDESVTWHYLCKMLSRSIVAMLRFMAHNPDNHDQPREKSELDMLFKTAVIIIEYQTLAYTNKALRGYLWHINAHFQWKSFIYTLSELCHRTSGQEVQHAWKQIEIVYESHPNFSKEIAKTAFLVAVTNLTLKAWNAHVAARVVPLEREPRFIQILRARKTKRENPVLSHPHSSSVPRGPPFEPNNSQANSQSLPQDIYQDPALTTQASHFDFSNNDFVPYLDDTSSFLMSQSHQQLIHALGPSAAADPTSSAIPTAEAPTVDHSSLFPPHHSSSELPKVSLADPEQMNWDNWDKLLEDFEMSGPGVGAGMDVNLNNDEVVGEFNFGAFDLGAGGGGEGFGA
ncbi:hypothetical protein DM02DRAFT_99098 [Periconia macrospinosa]|uniref:Zn(2)-C6 fungal-type domain-containing protein n=1 Tax=Periconia macrospinosa TaxID=97972 RepID=A0A2V1E4X6_9PLEO|nr:hypothetical protein DM02DRAFT_99098 [Periconia macrospinosa]